MNTYAVGFIFTGLAIFAALADIFSTKWWVNDAGFILNKGDAFRYGIDEGNRKYMLPNGDADMKKLITHKAIWAAIGAAVCILLFIFIKEDNERWFAFLPFLPSALVNLIQAFKNYQARAKMNRVIKEAKEKGTYIP